MTPPQSDVPDMTPPQSDAPDMTHLTGITELVETRQNLEHGTIHLVTLTRSPLAPLHPRKPGGRRKGRTGGGGMTHLKMRRRQGREDPLLRPQSEIPRQEKGL
eukprot:sb/3478286/